MLISTTICIDGFTHKEQPEKGKFIKESKVQKCSRANS